MARSTKKPPAKTETDHALDTPAHTDFTMPSQDDAAGLDRKAEQSLETSDVEQNAKTSTVEQTAGTSDVDQDAETSDAAGPDIAVPRVGRSAGTKASAAKTDDVTEPPSETSAAMGETAAGADSPDPEETSVDEPDPEASAETASTPRVDRDQVTGAPGSQDDASDPVADADTRPDANGGDGGTAIAPAPQPQIVEKRGPGFLPLVLGGLVAGAIGYAVPTFLMQDDAPTEVGNPAIDDSRIAAVEADVAELSARPASTAAIDESDLEAIRGAQAELNDRLGAIESRVGALEGRPAVADATQDLRTQVETLGSDIESLRADLTGRVDALAGDVDALSGQLGSLSDEVESLSGQFDTVSSEFETLRDDLGPRLDSVESQLSEVSARADDVEADAEAQAREAARNQVAIALESGAPFAEPLGVLGPAPWALFDAADRGVDTLGELRADFAPLAREALRAARAAETEPGVASLFRNAFNARSLEPREGDDPDAVLSRAEAAVDAGDLEGALDEIAALPEDAQAVLADWTERARTRAEAVAAANEFLKDG